MISYNDIYVKMINLFYQSHKSYGKLSNKPSCNF